MTDSVNTVPATQTARSVLKQLQKEFQVINECQPLAIGIDKQVIASLPDISRNRCAARWACTRSRPAT